MCIAISHNLIAISHYLTAHDNFTFLLLINQNVQGFTIA